LQLAQFLAPVSGGRQAALETASRTRLFARATSLGEMESLIEHRASILGPESRTPRNLLRLSVGIEEPADLIADVEQALK
jgi:cystathionine gamma-synthase